MTSKPLRPKDTRPAELIAAEEAGRQCLRDWLRAARGRHAALARTMNLAPPSLSRLAAVGGTYISMEYALRLELASRELAPDNTLRAEELCPARAELITQFAAGRRAA